MRRNWRMENEGLIRIIDRATGGRIKLSLDYAYGGVKVETNEGTEELSPRGTGREVNLWLHGFEVALRLEREESRRNRVILRKRRSDLAAVQSGH